MNESDDKSEEKINEGKIENEDKRGKKEEEEQEEEYFVVVPPNGGWGWVVVFCAFYCNFVIDGIQLTFGVFLKSISEEFAVESSKVALAGSLLFGIHLLMGPVCAGCNNAFGLRPVTITGTLISSFGIGISYFSTDCWFLCFSFGVIGGLGFGLVYMNTLVITSLYFTTRMPIALGIVVCGTGVGAMAFALAGNFFNKVISWRLSFLIEATLVGSLTIAAISFKPLKAVKVNISKDSRTEEEAESSRHRTSVFIKTDLLPRESILDSAFLQNPAWDLTEIETPDVRKREKCGCLKYCRKKKRESLEEQSFLVLSEIKLSDKRLSRKSYVEKAEIEENPEISRANSKKMYTRIDIPKKRKRFLDGLKQTLTTMLDCRLLSSCSFSVFTIGGAVNLAAFLMVFIYEKDRCQDLGFSNDWSVYFVVALGGVNVFWRLFFGCVGLIPNFRYWIAVIVGGVIGGIATMVSGYNRSVYYQFAFCFFFGLAVGSMSVFRVPIMIDMVGMEFFETAMGINLLFMGIACIVFPPIFGVVQEISNSYNLIFIISGSLIVIPALTLICLKNVDTEKIKNLKTVYKT